jgi:uncharacterized protein (DUF1501 family)
VHRRGLLGLAAGSALLSLGRRGWAVSGVGEPKRLVVILLRGAVDGLNVVIPYGDKAYAPARPTIAILPPGVPGGALALDGYFGLNPALSGLLPLWRDKTLGFIHAAGSPDPTRSHFDAQLFLENGTPGRKITADGWLNRLLAELPGPHGPTDALAIGTTIPDIFKGRLAVANLALGRAAMNPARLQRPGLSQAFDRLYAGNDPIAQAYQEGRTARAELTGALADEMRRADNGAPSPAGFPAEAVQLAHLLGRAPHIRLACLSLGGWDTHVNQGSQQGQLANHLRPLGDGLAMLAGGLGRAWADTVVVILSEFGRTVHENGDGGTDHGHGNVIWVLGGNVRGGRIYGDWPGLALAQLYQRRDLAVTTDYRLALAAILARHLRLSDTQLARIFPGLPPGRPDLGQLIAA